MSENDNWKKITKFAIKGGTALFGIYAVLNRIAKRKTESVNADADNPYIQEEENRELNSEPQNIYERKIKPTLDKALSFLGLIVLSPLYGLIAIAVYMDDPGPVFFTQKRVGRDKHFFYLHKYRSMRMSTPHDVPTHQLANPEKYITRVGRVLRMTSLDELPQIWDIFCGKMSIIGPRPALWNQRDLIEERERYGANAVLPGLTGIAQIKGRDELEIPVKAKYDGEYVRCLKQGGLKALLLDMRCFTGTFISVLKHDGVVEGGTGNLYKAP